MYSSIKLIRREIFGHFTSALGRRCAGGSVPSAYYFQAHISNISVLDWQYFGLVKYFWAPSFLARLIWSPDILSLFSTPSFSQAASDPLLPRSLFVWSFLPRSKCEQVSTYILLAIDFIINLLFTGQVSFWCQGQCWRFAQVYWFAKRGKLEKCGEAMMTLVLNEFLEFLVFSHLMPTS